MCLWPWASPGTDDAVAIELIFTGICRELLNRAREFRCEITSEAKRCPFNGQSLKNGGTAAQPPHRSTETQFKVLRCTVHLWVQC